VHKTSQEGIKPSPEGPPPPDHLASLHQPPSPYCGVPPDHLTDKDHNGNAIPVPSGSPPGQCVTDNAATDGNSFIKKGLLWQQRDKLFSRWKERFFILTKEYFHCFKKGSSRLTEMGGFIFKVKLSEIECVDLLDKRGYLTICITLIKDAKIYLRRPEGIREWHSCLQNNVYEWKKRRNFWAKRQVTDSSANIEQWLLARQKVGGMPSSPYVPGASGCGATDADPAPLSPTTPSTSRPDTSHRTGGGETIETSKVTTSKYQSSSSPKAVPPSILIKDPAARSSTVNNRAASGGQYSQSCPNSSIQPPLSATIRNGGINRMSRKIPYWVKKRFIFPFHYIDFTPTNKFIAYSTSVEI